MRTVLASIILFSQVIAHAAANYNVVCHLDVDGVDLKRSLGTCHLSNLEMYTRIENPKSNAVYKLDMSSCLISTRYKNVDYLIALKYVQSEDNNDQIKITSVVLKDEEGQRFSHTFTSDNGVFYLMRNLYGVDHVEGREIILGCADSIPTASPKTKKLRF